MPIEYPIPHYAHEDAESYGLWQSEVRAFRSEQRVAEAFPDTNAVLASGGRDQQFLEEQNPRRRFLRNPLNFFSRPPFISWMEAVDETGIIRKVYVIASNQTVSEDRRIIEYCLAGKSWRPAKRDGLAVPTLRATNLDYGESRFVSNYWWKAFNDEQAMAAVVFTAAALVGTLWAVIRRLRRRGRPSPPLPL
ncbi:MAG TPA: hypothetical protein VHL58_16610 [Thermoanaerobaculia bacterium]|nr:hypothetical protein [Thermoanaerobaculia bacterium]